MTLIPTKSLPVSLLNDNRGAVLDVAGTEAPSEGLDARASFIMTDNLKPAGVEIRLGAGNSFPDLLHF